MVSKKRRSYLDCGVVIMFFKSSPRRPVEFLGWALASPRPIVGWRPPCSRSCRLGAIWRCLRPERSEADAARACTCARGRGSGKWAVRGRGKGRRGFARQRDRRESSTGGKSGAYISRMVEYLVLLAKSLFYWLSTWFYW